MSPDPLAGDIGNPQSLNRYAYVLNNPETFIDPLGMWVCGWWLYSNPGADQYAGGTMTCAGGGGAGTSSEGGAALLEWGWSGFTYMPNAYEYTFAARFSASILRAGARAARNAAQTQPTKQSYQQCMSNWNNTAAGQVVSFFSLLNAFRHPFEWFGIGGAKMAGIHLLDKGEQSTAATDYSITAGTSAEPAVLDGSGILGVA